MSSSRTYRFDRPRVSDMVHDMFITAADLGPGQSAGSFDLPTTDGGAFRSTDLHAQRQWAFVIFGSQTCPVTASAVEGLARLHRTHGNAFRFVLVQVREAHPGERVAQPHTPDAKAERARALQRHFAIPFEVAIDDIEGTLHRRLGARPNSAFVLDPDGIIRLHVQWANETDAINEALDAFVSGAAPPAATITRTLPAILKAVGHMPSVLKTAGRRAVIDTALVAPPMAMMMAASKLFPFLPPDRRGLPALLVLVALGVVAVTAGVAFL